MADGLNVQVQFSAGVWTDITTDTMASAGLSASRGIQAGGPLDRVATTGLCEFTLKNGPTSDDVARPNGYYSLASSACRTGWTFGAPVRIRYTISATPYTLWTGSLRSATPTTGRYGERTVRVLAVDAMNALAETDVRTISPQVSQTENAIIAAIIAALPTASQPTMSYDTSLDTYPYALDNASSGNKALGLIADVVMSAQAFCFCKADGTVRIENRLARPSRASSYTFTDATLWGLEVPGDTAGLYNRVRTVIHPRSIDAAATTVLFGITTAQEVPANSSITIWGDYANPTNAAQLIGGTAAVTPIVSGTDYAGNAAADGSGANVTASLSVVTTAYAAAVQFVVTNSSGSDIFLVNTSGVPLLQLRGKGIYDEAPVSYDAASVQSYGERIAIVDLPYQDNGNTAQERATFLERQYRSLSAQVTSLTFSASTSSALLTQGVTREIGDVITITETMSGLVAVDAVIHAIAWSFTAPGWMTVRYTLSPRVASTSLILDDAVYGVLDAAVAALGYA